METEESGGMHGPPAVGSDRFVLSDHERGVRAVVELNTAEGPGEDELEAFFEDARARLGRGGSREILEAGEY